MNKSRDIVFKIGLGLQLLLIPVAFLWRFGQEANYYNWVITIAFLLIVCLFAWPQAITVRVKRLAAIRLQLTTVFLMLILCWGAYSYFHTFYNDYFSADNIAPLYSVNWESIFGARWVMWLNPGISMTTALVITATCIALPLANLYRYQLDKKRIKGIKKEDLFI